MLRLGFHVAWGIVLGPFPYVQHIIASAESKKEETQDKKRLQLEQLLDNVFLVYRAKSLRIFSISNVESHTLLALPPAFQPERHQSILLCA